MTLEIEDVDRMPVERESQSGSLLPMIQQAIANGAAPETLEKFLELHQRWLDARAKERFGEALAAFQSECPQIHKGRKTTGGGFNFHYASLDDVMKVAQPILARHGISLAFDSLHSTAEKVNLINVTLTIRVGSYAEDRKFGCPVPTDLKASQPQQWGAALSYAKRYALCAALNIVVTDEDTDAANVVSTITATEMIEIESLIAQSGTSLERFLAWLGVESLDLMPRERYKQASEYLRKKLPK